MTGTASRDEHVDQSAGSHQVLHRVVRRPGDELHGVDRQPDGGQRLAHHLDQHGVGVVGRRRATQQHSVARLQAQPGGVDSDVRPGLVDHSHNPERHPTLADRQPVRQRVAGDDLADGVGEGSDLA
jgi:hypothetical protein